MLAKQPAVDTLNWLKSQNRGYQSRINAILRWGMLPANRATMKSAGSSGFLRPYKFTGRPLCDHRFRLRI